MKAWVCLIVLLAGCLQGHSPAGTAPGPGVKVSDPAVPTGFHANPCRGYGLVFELDKKAVEPEMPPHYILEDRLARVSTGLNNPHLVVLLCDLIRVGNATERNVAIAYTGTLLTTGNLYRWEVFIDEPGTLLADAFHANGWPALAANITVTPSAASVYANGTLYELQYAPADPVPFIGSASTSIEEHLGNAGRHLWMSENLGTADWPWDMRASQFHAQNGVLGRILARAGPESQLATNGWVVTDASGQFGRSD